MDESEVSLFRIRVAVAAEVLIAKGLPDDSGLDPDIVDLAFGFESGLVNFPAFER